MAHKHMTVQEAIDYIHNDDSFDDITFRGDDFTPANKFRKSCYRGDDTAQFQLDGVSAVCAYGYRTQDIIRAISRAREYGQNVFMLRGRSKNADDTFCDPDEVLMKNHKIVCIIDANFEGYGINKYRLV